MSSDATLKSLYPFLHGDKQDAGAMADALAESVRQKAAHHVIVFDDFFARNAGVLAAAAETVAETYRKGGRLLTMGNGGSSCDAAHVAVEFQHPVTAGRPALPAINLTSDVAMMTAVGAVGFLWALAAVHGIVGLFALYRMTRRASIAVTEQMPMVDMAPRGTSIATLIAAQTAAEEAAGDSATGDSVARDGDADSPAIGDPSTERAT